MLLYHTINLILWVLGFGVIVWKAGWLPAVGLFLIFWANYLFYNTTAKQEHARRAEAKQAAREQAHIESNPDRFGNDPNRTRYF